MEKVSYATLCQESSLHYVWLVDTHTEGTERTALYIISNRAKTAAALVDVGSGIGYALRRWWAALKECGIAKEALTHIHVDHFAACGVMLKQLPNAIVLVHPEGAVHVEKPAVIIEAFQAVGGERFEKYYRNVEPTPANKIRQLVDGESIEIFTQDEKPVTMVSHFSPGHAPHHITYQLALPAEIAITDVKTTPSVPHSTPIAPPADCVGERGLTVGLFPGDSLGACYLPQHTAEAGGPVIMPQVTVPFDLLAFRRSVEMLSTMKPIALFMPHFGVLPWQDDIPARTLAMLDRILAEVPLDKESPHLSDILIGLCCIMGPYDRTEGLMEDLDSISAALLSLRGNTGWEGGVKLPAWHKQESQESRKAATAPATTAAVPAPVPAAAN